MPHSETAQARGQTHAALASVDTQSDLSKDTVAPWLEVDLKGNRSEDGKMEREREREREREGAVGGWRG